MRALVIGANGFVGRWLIRHLAEAGDEVHAAVGPRSGPSLPVAVAVHQLDVLDEASVRGVMRSAAPQALYYLAGVSEPKAREDLRIEVGVAVIGALNVLTAAAELAQPPRLLLVGSSHMYATASDEHAPLTEDTPLGGPSVYGGAKAAAEAAAFALTRRGGVEVVAARPFNHIGPGQTTSFVVPALAEQVAAISAGTAPPTIHTGSLDARRDFTDVRDVVRAYRLLISKGTAGTAYNVASGHAVSIREVLDRLLARAGVNATVAEDASLLRSAEPAAVVGDASRLRRQTGWEPTITLDQSLRDVLDEALARNGAPAPARWRA